MSSSSLNSLWLMRRDIRLGTRGGSSSIPSNISESDSISSTGWEGSNMESSERRGGSEPSVGKPVRSQSWRRGASIREEKLEKESSRSSNTLQSRNLEVGGR